jgi:hypothetical protein
MNWFEDLTGISPETPESVYDNLSIQNDEIVSSINGWRAKFGPLTTPSLAELRTQNIPPTSAPIEVSEIIADVQRLHMQPENAGATFQVASQFNLLEMMGPSFTPELGVGIYEDDATQGPACAIACLAGTIYRNYFVPVDGGVGQTRDRQIDCIKDLGSHLGSDRKFLWEMRNGYALPTRESLEAINDVLLTQDIDFLRGLMRVGIQRDTEVTTNSTRRTVTQVYCSAMPVAYSNIDASIWEPLSRLVLEAAYEATLIAAQENAIKTGNNRLFLTMLGGGAFGNRREWISEAMLRALRMHRLSGLKIFLVSYGQSSALARDVIEELT